jgi:hypothetical protein
MRRLPSHALTALLALAATVFVGTGVAANFQVVPGAIARAFGFRGGIAAAEGLAVDACPVHGQPCGDPELPGVPGVPHDPTTCDTCTVLFLAGFAPTVAPAPVAPLATLEILDSKAIGLVPSPAPLRAIAARPPPVA